MISPDRRLYDFTNIELENSPLAELAKRAGYASLRSLCNEQNRWTETASELETFLNEQINPSP